MFQIALHWGGNSIVMENNQNIVEASSAKTVMKSSNIVGTVESGLLLCLLTVLTKQPRTLKSNTLVLALADKCNHEACLNC